MISKRRIWTDILGQGVLLIALAFLLLPQPGKGGMLVSILLGLWQLASALHLLYAYRYAQKKHFLRAGLVVVVAALLWSKWVGGWAYLPVVGLFLWYFGQTLYDGLRVARRPKSFWNLRF
jgi:chromate transport protein ChrA